MFFYVQKKFVIRMNNFTIEYYNLECLFIRS